MNEVHDLGGVHGFGPVRPERDEPVFHAEWERRVLALVLAIGALGRWNIDQNRHTRESLPPVTYLSSSYYRIWFLALLENLNASGLIVERGIARSWPEILPGLTRGTPYLRETGRTPAFVVGQRVRTSNENPAGHTRLPRYARHHIGTIVLSHGAHVFPDANAVPIGQASVGDAEFLYTVEFTGTDLWGADSDPHLVVSVDAFEPYLEAVIDRRDHPPFTEPWQARAFALAVDLHEKGQFAWTDFSAALGERIAARPDPEDYWECWVDALTAVVLDPSNG